MSSKALPKGTEVRLRTTNGGDTIAKLARDYVPSYPAWIEPCDGHVFVVLAERIRSIEPTTPHA